MTKKQYNKATKNAENVANYLPHRMNLIFTQHFVMGVIWIQYLVYKLLNKRSKKCGGELVFLE